MGFNKLPSQILPSGATLTAVIAVINIVQNFINSFIQNFTGKPQFNSNLLINVVLHTGTNNIAHKLNGSLTGYIVIGQNAPATFYQTTGSSPNTYLYLVSSAPCTASFEVY